VHMVKPSDDHEFEYEFLALDVKGKAKIRPWFIHPSWLTPTPTQVILALSSKTPPIRREVERRVH